MFRLVGIALFLVLCIGNSFAVVSKAPIDVRVGGYIFEPFIMETKEDGQWRGLTFELIDALNSIQKDYHFTFVHTSSLRRFNDLQNHRFDMIFFENKKWGWDGYPVTSSRVFLRGGEVYVALKKESGKRDQSYFRSFEGKKIVGVDGFHYGFIKYRPLHTSSKDLEITSVQSGMACLGMVIKERADIAIVSYALVKKFLGDYPEYSDSLLISEKFDQEYHHTILLHQESPVTSNQINGYLDKLQQKGLLQQIWKTNHITDSP